LDAIELGWVGLVCAKRPVSLLLLRYAVGMHAPCDAEE
jgi:hypothetical protein